MKLYEKNGSFKHVSIRGFNGLSCLVGALVLVMAISLSARAQIAPTPPALLNTNGTADTGGDFIPKVTTDSLGNWVAVWYSFENLGGTAGTDADIFVATSTDYGASWTGPALLNTNGTTDTGSDRRPQLTTDGLGNWVAVWHSPENLGGTAGTDDDIFVATSTDNGASWTAPALLNTNGTTDTDNDEQPHVTTDGAGNWVTVWRSEEDLGGTAGTDSDIFVATSTDNGASWTAPALLNTNGTTDTGSDEEPHVTTDGLGNWVAVWDSTENLGGTVGTDDDIFVTTFVFPGGGGGGGGGGCFIASAAYGTPMASDINALRHFRDAYLLTTPLGTLFVDGYYRTSPPIADFVANHPAAATMVRAALTPVVFVLSSPWRAMAIALLLMGAFMARRQVRVVRVK